MVLRQARLQREKHILFARQRALEYEEAEIQAVLLTWPEQESDGEREELVARAAAINREKREIRGNIAALERRIEALRRSLPTPTAVMRDVEAVGAVIGAGFAFFFDAMAYAVRRTQ